MILIIGGRSARYLVTPYGRKRARSYAGGGQPGLKTEITRLDLEIASLSGRTQALSHKLGELYALFRCENRLKDCTSGAQADMLALSRETDDCIDKLYKLEKQRGLLLEKMNA